MIVFTVCEYEYMNMSTPTYRAGYATARQINDIRDTGPDTENSDHGPDMGFYGPLVNQSE